MENQRFVQEERLAQRSRKRGQGTLRWMALQASTICPHPKSLHLDSPSFHEKLASLLNSWASELLLNAAALSPYG